MEDEIEYCVTFLLQISATLTEEFGGGVGVFRRKVLQLQWIFFECNWRLMYVTVFVRIACLTLKMAAFTHIYIYSISLLLNGCIFLSTFKM